jgi:hypothetical protein
LQDQQLCAAERARYLSPEGTRLVQVLVDRFAHYFDKDLDNPIVLLACFLDPRYHDWGFKAKERMVQGKDESDEHFGWRQALVEYFRSTWNQVSVKMHKALYAVYKQCFPIQFRQDPPGLSWQHLL